MKKIIILLLFSPVVQAFQTEISGSFSSTDLDPDSSATAYAVTYQYYMNDLAYENQPFKETAFLNSISSIELALGYADYDFDSSKADGSLVGIKSVLYQDNFALDITVISLSVSSDSSSSSFDTTIINLEPGLKFSNSNMLYGIYTNATTENFDTITLGAGYKTVVSNMSFTAEATSSDQDTAFDDVKSSRLEALVEYYLNSKQFVGIGYEAVSSDNANNEADTVKLSFGGLIAKRYLYEANFREAKTKTDETNNSFEFELGLVF